MKRNVIALITILILVAAACVILINKKKQADKLRFEERIEKDIAQSLSQSKQEVSPFSVIVGDEAIEIGSFNRELNLKDLLGDKLSESIEESGTNEVPENHCSIKIVEYQGIQIKFIKAYGRENGSYLSYNITANDSKFETPLGVKTGDDIEKLRKTYPESYTPAQRQFNEMQVSVNDNVNEEGDGTYTYINADVCGEYYLKFNLEKGKIISFEITSMGC